MIIGRYIIEFFFQKQLLISPPPLQTNVRKILLKRGLLFARYTSDFDCGKETEWYYVIKDDFFDVNLLKAKYRYEVNKGNKNFYTKVIIPMDYYDDIFRISVEAYSAYPAKYRPVLSYENYRKSVQSWQTDDVVVIGGFDRITGDLCGFACLICHEEYISYSMHKVIPVYEKLAVNAALVNGVLNYFREIGKYKYIIDGERAIRHETKFQEYLIKYFSFRKAYCRLNIIYNPIVKYIVYILYPFRNILGKFKEINFLYNIYCILKQEEIRRTFS